MIIYKGNLYEEFDYLNPIKGGRGDNLKNYDKDEMKKGIKAEREHVENNKELSPAKKRAIQADIAKDHLAEIPDYYTKLEKIEKSM